MNDLETIMPVPENPYRKLAVLNALLGFAGLVSLSISGGPSRAHPWSFLVGVMMLTLSFILFFGVAYGWTGFSRRFARERLLGYWEIPSFDWDEFIRKRSSKLMVKGGILSIVFPLLVTGVILVLAALDGELMKVLPVAFGVGGLMFLMFWVIIAIQLWSLRGNSGKVWLAEKGIVINRSVFFSDGYGIRLMEWRMVKGKRQPELSMKYEVRSGRTTAEHELVVPVPENRVSLVEQTVSGWF